MSLKSLPKEQFNALLALSIPDFRQALGVMVAKTMMAQPEPIDIPAKIEDSSFKGPASDIPIRIYTPEGTGPFPAVVFYHGGGWVLGNIQSHDSICRQMCVQTGAVVISVEYRLAPEAKFPAGPNDCYAAFHHVQSNPDKYGIDAERVAVAGDSAGGNLATVVSIMCRDRQAPRPKFQCLIYPACDFTANGPHKQSDPSDLLVMDFMNYMKDGYINGPEDEINPLASPLKADLHDLPPAFVMTCSMDPLLEEGVEYVQKLKASGVPCEHINAIGMDHGCFSQDRRTDPDIQQYQDAAFAAIKKALI
ncbi:hypothetical protein K450DRAFT_268971 [Umbelopsis ramanniana AG]|uniref:Alpha/beta hydrolase fold-3 domain-containing protein n=1 Tax=Umbelopsis ramanniana AG TaxID=1314678 RepID=A0AAD5EFN7_UMBRA|nr:uncharacterized protein K450DRAFT_268971 [Umbelopsis ramanniana AG]KAI8582609.1 hypothetical protein K450DRAFT_268971 [Umbelopsis ramanniana AG]